VATAKAAKSEALPQALPESYDVPQAKRDPLLQDGFAGERINADRVDSRLNDKRMDIAHPAGADGESSIRATYSQRREPSRWSGQHLRSPSEPVDWQASILDDWRSPSVTSNSEAGSNSSGYSDTESEDLNDVNLNSTDALDPGDDASHDEHTHPPEAGRACVNDPSDFDYSTPSQLSSHEILSLSLYQIKTRRTISHDAHNDYISVVSLMAQEHVSDHRTVEALLERTTGISHIQYDVCRQSCVCFNFKYSNATVCPLCNTPRYDPNGKPWKTFDYIPIQHRLRLQYANPQRAQEFTQYRQSLKLDAHRRVQEGEEEELRDFWDGKLCTQLQAKGFLTASTDLAFAFSTDGVDLFRKGKKHQVWPLLLTCFNLSPENRFLEDNIFCLGVVPGPTKPADLDSFLYPMVEEFKCLQRGVRTPCGLGNSILLRAYIVTVTADMPARDSLMGLAGYNSRHFCNYCTARGCTASSEASAGGGGKHMYCPLVPPQDVPQAPDWLSYDPAALSMRNEADDRSAAEKFHHRLPAHQQMSQPLQTATTRATGIKSYSVLWELSSIVWPWSFPIDNMHLFFLNIASYMRDHWRGNFFSWERSGNGKTSASKFKNSEEQYCLSPETWKAMDQDLRGMVFPTAFGDQMRGVYELRKANEYKTWTKIVSPILLNGRLPEPFYTDWIAFVDAVTLATDYSLTTEEITHVRAKMQQFVVHYHDNYYKYENKRLAACKSVFHALLHVADCLEWVGPMWSYGQWFIERMFALWTPKVTARMLHLMAEPYKGLTSC
jgi:hypothetical protein